MSRRTEKISKLLKEKLDPVSIIVEDDSAKHAGHAGAKESGGGHYVVSIVATCFTGKTRVERQRMVFSALGGMFPSEIHALSVSARSPDEVK